MKRLALQDLQVTSFIMGGSASPLSGTSEACSNITCGGTCAPPYCPVGQTLTCVPTGA